MRRTLQVGEEWDDLLLALTVLQPFATALCDPSPESKWCENRDWRRTYPAGGLWCAIHAGQKIWAPTAKERGKLLDTLTRNTGWRAHQQSYTPGAIIGLVRFTACVPVEARPNDPWASGPWCHVIDRAITLPAPIVGVKGALGFWKLSPEHSATLRDLIREAR